MILLNVNVVVNCINNCIDNYINNMDLMELINIGQYLF